MRKEIVANRRDEAWMGRYTRWHTPRLTAHHLVNAFIPARGAFAPSAVIVQQKQFPDVSFWQGKIDWDKMRGKTDTVVIRAGQNEWEDIEFKRNYTEAGRRGMLRGVYWFYDDRKDPGRQADKCISLIAADPPEMKVYTDWEVKYGGAFGGLKNVVAFMQRIETLPPLESALYTGYYFFQENSNPITNAAQYNYLKAKELWLAFYATPDKVLVPAPLTLTHLQYGTPARGLEFGCETLEIDMNITALTDGEFYNRYGGEPLPPPDEEEPMTTIKEYIVSAIKLGGATKLNIRDGAGGSGLFNDIGDLFPGEKVYGQIVSAVWLEFNKIIRKDGRVEMFHGFASTQYMDFVREIPIEPQPTLPDIPVRIELGDDVTYTKQVVVTTLKPKA